MRFTRVISVNGRLQICARDKVYYSSYIIRMLYCCNIFKICDPQEISNLYVMFHTRLVLHWRASQQTTKRLIEQMLVSILLLLS